MAMEPSWSDEIEKCILMLTDPDRSSWASLYCEREYAKKQLRQIGEHLNGLQFDGWIEAPLEMTA